MFGTIKRFLLQDIWNCRTSAMSTPRALLTRFLRIVVLSLQLFAKSKCQLRASSLTLLTLMSIVPVAAMIFGIAKGYGFEAALQEKLRESLVGHEEVADKIIAFASSMLENAKGGMIAGVGVLILLGTVVWLLSGIEESLNDIWGVKTGRALLRKASDYLSVLMICPFLIIASGSATVFVASRATGLSDALHSPTAVNIVLRLCLEILPVVVTCLVFTFLYAFMPNTKVRLMPALTGGIIAGILYNVMQGLYVVTQIGVARYNAIYGSFAALPLFLFWLEVSWMIALFGATISFAVQNERVYELDLGDRGISLARRKLHLLELARQAALDFEAGSTPKTDEELSQLYEIPVRTARQLLFELVSAKILAPTIRFDGAQAYIPALPTERMTPVKILAAVEHLGEDLPPKAGKVSLTLETLNKSMEAAAANRPLSKI